VLIQYMRVFCFVWLGPALFGCGWKLKRTSDSTLALVRPVTGVRRTGIKVGLTGLKVGLVGMGWSGFGLGLTTDVV
jgi:hypothetical protein